MAKVETIQKVLEIQFKDSQLLKGMQETSVAIEDNNENIKNLKNNYKALQKLYKEGKVDGERMTRAQYEYNRSMSEAKAENKALQAQLSSYERELQNNIKAQTSAQGSLTQMRATVKNLELEYEGLSKAERESARGEELRNKILALNDTIRTTDQSIGNFKTTVGQYKDSMLGALIPTNGMLGGLVKMSAAAPTVSGGFTAMAQGAKAFGKALLALLANPIVLILGAIALAIKGIVSVMKTSEEQTNRISVALAPFKRIMDMVLNQLQKAVGFIISLVEGAGKLLNWVMKAAEKLPIVGESIKEFNEEIEKSIELEKREQDLIKQTRKDQVQNAKDELKIAELKKKSREKDKYSAEERLAAIQEANELERQMAERNVRRAEEEYAILAERAQWAENATEINEKLAEKEAAMYRARKEYFDHTQRMASQEATLRAEIAKEEEEAERLRQKRFQREIKAMETLEKLQEEVREKTEAAELEALDKRIKIEEAKIDEQIAKLGEDEIEAKKMLEEAKTLLTQKGAKERASIEAKWAKSAFDQEVRRRELLLQQSTLMANPNDRSEYLKAQAEQALGELRIMEDKLSELQNLSAEAARARFDSEAAYQNAIIEGENAILAAKHKVQNANQEIATYNIQLQQQQYETTSSMVSGLSNLFAALGDEIEAFGYAQKALAIVQVIIDAQKATMAALASSIAMGPAGPAWFATQKIVIGIQEAASIASIVAQMIPKFADGGLVVGPGTGTSDSVPAMLSNGEAVMTAAAVQSWGALLSAFNVASGGRPIASEKVVRSNDGFVQLGKILSDAVKRLPAPVVSVVDINNGQRKVRVLDRMAKL